MDYPLQECGKSCVEYFLEHFGLVTLGSKLKELPEDVIDSVFALVRILVDDVCTSNSLIAKNEDLVIGLTSFLQSLITYDILDSQRQLVLGRLLLEMASLMKIYDGLLLKWFKIIEKLGGAPEQLSPGRISNRNKAVFRREFPLLYLLVKNAHNDTQLGDYARTGLLYLIGIISKSTELVNWAINSDLAALMVSSLGALYSQISRGDSLDTNNKHIFFTYLLFWQDLLSVSVDSHQFEKYLVMHFDFSFVRQLLYPTMTENFDNVLLFELFVTILQKMDQNLLSQSIICYFVNFPIFYDESSFRVPSFQGQVSDVKASINTMLISLLSSNDDNTKAIALKAIKILLKKFYPYILQTVIFVQKVSNYQSRKEKLQLLEKVQNCCSNSLHGILTIKQQKDSVQKYCQDLIFARKQTFFPTKEDIQMFLPEELSRFIVVDSKLRCNYPQGPLVYHRLSDLKESEVLSHVLKQMREGYFTKSINENLFVVSIITELCLSGWLVIDGWFTSYLLATISVLSSNFWEFRSKIKGFSLLIEELKNQNFEKHEKEFEALNLAPEKSKTQSNKRSFSLMSYSSMKSLIGIASSEESDSVSVSDNSMSEIVVENCNFTQEQQELFSRLREEKIEMNNEQIPLMQICTNALIFQNFVCELEALYHVKLL